MNYIEYYRKQPLDVRQHARLVPPEEIERYTQEPADGDYGRVHYLRDGRDIPGVLIGFVDGAAIVILGYGYDADASDPSTHRWGGYPMLGASDPDCPICHGTGLAGGFQAPCRRGCEVRP